MAEHKESWHLDKKVPVAIIIAILIQCGAFIWTFAQVESRVTQLERRAAEQTATLQNLPVQVGRLEERITSLNATLERIEKKMDRRREER